MTADEETPRDSSAALPGDAPGVDPARGRAAPGGPEPAWSPEPGTGRQRAPRPETARRPLFERIGMASIALVVAVLFGGIGIAAWIGGEPFLGIMALIGAVMTAWAGANTLLRG